MQCPFWVPSRKLPHLSPWKSLNLGSKCIFNWSSFQFLNSWTYPCHAWKHPKRSLSSSNSFDLWWSMPTQCHHRVPCHSPKNLRSAKQKVNTLMETKNHIHSLKIYRLHFYPWKLLPSIPVNPIPSPTLWWITLPKFNGWNRKMLKFPSSESPGSRVPFSGEPSSTLGGDYKRRTSPFSRPAFPMELGRS